MIFWTATPTDMQTPGFGTFPGWEFKKYPRVTGFGLKSPGSEMQKCHERFHFSKVMLISALVLPSRIKSLKKN